MHFILSLYDAPVPARGALAALNAAGVSAGDIAVAPPLQAETPVGDGRPRLVLPESQEAIGKALVAWGVPPADALVFAEGVGRGAILVAVRAPTLLAAPVRTILEQSGAVPLSVHKARWEADPALRYGWAGVAAPEVEGPG